MSNRPPLSLSGEEPKGWVVKNIYGPNAYTGVQDPFLTEGGKVLVWPYKESIPEHWRVHAVPAHPEHIMHGRVLRLVKEKEPEA